VLGDEVANRTCFSDINGNTTVRNVRAKSASSYAVTVGWKPLPDYRKKSQNPFFTRDRRRRRHNNKTNRGLGGACVVWTKISLFCVTRFYIRFSRDRAAVPSSSTTLRARLVLRRPDRLPSGCRRWSLRAVRRRGERRQTDKKIFSLSYLERKDQQNERRISGALHPVLLLGFLFGVDADAARRRRYGGDGSGAHSDPGFCARADSSRPFPAYANFFIGESTRTHNSPDSCSSVIRATCTTLVCSRPNAANIRRILTVASSCCSGSSGEGSFYVTWAIVNEKMRSMTDSDVLLANPESACKLFPVLATDDRVGNMGDIKGRGFV
jgi:hypothetical protein